MVGRVGQFFFLATIAAGKNRLVEQMDGGSDVELIRLHISANDSVNNFNALTPRQLKSRSATKSLEVGCEKCR